jgi:hypothetical protein
LCTTFQVESLHELKMRRINPVQSLPGLIATFLLLTGLGMMLWLRGGEAFSPGSLTAISHSGLQAGGFRSHAEFEPECSKCHQPLKTTQGELCLDCHVEVAAQLDKQNGTHAHIQDANRCATCHSDHQGRDFDPTRQAFNHFDHTLTHFSLLWHQVNYDASPMDCTACHTMEPVFAVSIAECLDCHSARDEAFVQQHIQDFGDDCLQCHDGKDQMINFDHQATDFKLEGQHAAARCGSCHSNEARARQQARQPGRAGFALLTREERDEPTTLLAQFWDTPIACGSCHTEPEMHRGMFSEDCATCHNAQSWSPAILDGKQFEHAKHTGFSLQQHLFDANEQPIRCNDCHQSDLKAFDVQTCITCHSLDDASASFMQQHTAEVGLSCKQCHDGVDRMEYFDHNSVFPLQGRHAGVACLACHTDYNFIETTAACVQCHAEPAIHAGSFGLQCQYCHTDQAWQPAQLRQHRLPLDHGGQGEIKCQTCHTQRYDEITCYGCHEHQPEPIQASHLAAGVSLEDLPRCAACHPDGLQGEQTKIGAGE